MCLIRNILFFSFLVGLVLAAGAQQKPNIVVILVDDAGNKDWGFQGSTVSQTPAIDNLASLGTIFTQGYVTNSVCAPSRAGMLTGQYQNKFGFEGNIVEYTSPPDHDDQDVGLDPSVPTIGNYLQDLGYSTGLFGKWHLGVEEHHRPNARGFDYFYGLLGGSRDYNVVETEFARQLRRNGAIAEPSGDFYVTDLLTDEALEYMTEQIDMNRPFMAFMSYTAPHSPFQAKAEDKALFTHLTELSDKQHEYYGMIKNVDDNVQRIVDLLQAKNEFDNTLFVFLSDNGGVSITDNGELRGGKSSKYEGGLRVPFFATYVDGIPSGATYENQVIALDLASTFVKAAGGDLSENTYAELDGGDLIAAANGETSIHDRLFWRKSDTWSIVSDGTNKLIFDVHTDDFTRYDTLLYNLDEDLSEKSDIYSSNRASVQSMVADFKEWNATLDLPSWIGSQYLMPRVCGEVTDAKQCQIMIDRYADFAAATQMGNVAKKRWRVRLGESATLDKSTLEYVDPIKSAAVIEYQLEDLPRHGMLTKDGNPLESEDLFTQLDINTGMIKYVHGGSTASLDSIQYRVSDGSGHEDFDNQILKIIVDDHVFSAEFEDGDLSGSTEIRTTCAFAGEGEFVRLNEDGMITFPDINAPEAGNYLLRIYYYIDGDDANLELIVNGESSALLLPNADWCFVGPATEFVTLVSLQAGNNTISFKRSEDPPPSLDYFYIDELKPFPISFEANQLRLLEGDSIEVHISVPSKLPTSESFTVSLEGLSEEQYQLSQTALTINAGEQSTSTVLQSTGGVGSANLVLGGFSAYLKAGEQASMAVHILDEGQTIFISNSGSDSNDGLSLATALKSLEGINSLSLIPGDSVLFKRGEVFKG
ncbi:MAG: sulfatase-like hydrolase/transferase, partial [Ekhidna sp.]|nr:sulfatase-like hydrolase/transferase [Ekhidna sp.]